jgi:hypothetical protein
MAKVNLDVPDDLHLQVKMRQLSLEADGKKVSLKDVYYELIRRGLVTEKPLEKK